MTPTPEDERILVQRDGHVTQIVFNNPARHNAISLSMWQGLTKNLTILAADPDVRVVVLTGAGGRAFVSGADISEFETERSTPEAVTRYNRTTEIAEAAVASFPKPIIAKIDGYCLGGGVGLAIACDIRVCSPKSKFAIPAGKLGLGYDYAGVAKLLATIGPAAAAEFFMTGRMFTAEEAAGLGLVNRVTEPGALDDETASIVDMIAANAPMTVATFKAALLEYAKPSGQRDTARVDRMVAECFASEDYAEGRAAFAERRTPVFQGR